MRSICTAFRTLVSFSSRYIGVWQNNFPIIHAYKIGEPGKQTFSHSNCMQLESNWNGNGTHSLVLADVSCRSSVWDFSFPFSFCVFFDFLGLQHLFHYCKEVIPIKFTEQIKTCNQDVARTGTVSKTDTKLSLWINTMNSSIPFKAFSYVLKNSQISLKKHFKINTLCNHPTYDTSY